jgi:hypothetical protein
MEMPICKDTVGGLIGDIQPPLIVQQDSEEQTVIPDTPRISQKLFSQAVELLVEQLDLNYIDAILQTAAYYEIQYGDVKKLLAPQIMDKLKMESIKMHLVRDDSKIEALF